MSAEVPSPSMDPNSEANSTSSVSVAAAPVPQVSRFYRLDSSRLSFTELWRHSRSPEVPLVWLTKLLRIKLPVGSVDDPNVPSLRPFIVPDEDTETMVPPEIRRTMQPALRELADLGFAAPVYVVIDDRFQHACGYHVAMLHRDGRALARLRVQVEGVQKTRTTLFSEFISAFANGRFLWSTSARAPSFAPPSCRLNWKYEASASQLWLLHRQQLDAATGHEGPAQPIQTREDMLDALERHHEAVRDFNLQRGIFAPMRGEDLARAQVLERSFEQAQSGQLRHPEVLAQLELLQKRHTSWTSAIVVLLVSIGLFVGAGAGGLKWSREMLLMIVGLLLWHEAGHYAAMKIFRYRNVRMFFIPFFGAAVSGQHYTAPGWKKVIVSLMGPLPGIVLGGALGVAGLMKGDDLLVRIATFALILNGINLLPILPLDGGHVMHTLLFSRHYALDGIFRVFAAVALVAIGMLTDDRILLYLGIFMGIGIPAAFKIGKLATDLRRRPIEMPEAASAVALVPVAPPTLPYAPDAPMQPAVDEHAIPAPIAEAIIDHVMATFPKVKGAGRIASLTVQVYERLTNRPPGVVASIGFGFLHVGSFVAALLLLTMLTISQNPHFWEMNAARSINPTHVVEAGEMVTVGEFPPVPRVVAKPAASSASFNPLPPRGHDTIVATFPTSAKARATFEETQTKLPAPAALVYFGQSVFLAVPSVDKAACAKWFEEFETRTDDVFIESNDDSTLASFTLKCRAASAAQASAGKEELSAYFQLPSTFRLIPPWADPRLDGRSAEQRARHELARATYRKLRRGLAGEAPELKALRDQQNRATRRNDQVELQRLREQEMELEFTLNMAAFERIRDGADGPVDRELADRYIALEAAEQQERKSVRNSSPTNAKPVDPAGSGPAAAESIEEDSGDVEQAGRMRIYQRFFRRQCDELAPLMGTLPAAPDASSTAGPGLNCMPRHGYVQVASAKQLVITVTFEDLAVGTPALIRWLASRGFGDFKYDLELDEAYEDDEDD